MIHFIIKCHKQSKMLIQYDLHRLGNHEIQDNLEFTGSGFVKKYSYKKSKKKSKNDAAVIKEIEEIKYLYVTKFNVLNRFSINGIIKGRFLSEGDKVIIKFKKRSGSIERRIAPNKRGIVTAVFSLKKGQYPPGYK